MSSKLKWMALGWGIAIIAGLFTLITSQQYPIYLDLTPTQNLSPARQLNERLNHVDQPFSITIFSSKQLSDDLSIPLLTRWINSLSPSVSIQQYDPATFPAKADHYDISNDGVIVIEHNGNRTDIDLIEQIIINEGHGLDNIQNLIARAMIQMSQTSSPAILIIHSSQSTLLDDNSAMGLSSFQDIVNQNFANISEIHVNDLVKFNHSYDLVIFYKLSTNAKNQLPVLSKLYQQMPSTIIFNHPKFSDMSNQLVSNPDIQFNPGILEDPINHLMRSNNQLIVDVQSQLNQPLIGVFPYASFIDFDSASGLRSLATTQPEAIVQINNDRIEGPFSIIAQSSDHTRTYINNYLFITNHWLTQGDNKLILTDILQSHLDDFPLLFPRDTSNDFIILTKMNLLKLVVMLLILPLLVLFFVASIIKQVLRNAKFGIH